jgi:hypothetical protein
MSHRLFQFWMIWATIFIAFGVVGLGKAMLAFHHDYYWTPSTRQESLEQRNGRFELYVRGKLLERRLQQGELALRSGDSWLPLEEADLSIRLNHIDEVTRSSLLYGVGFASAGLAWLSALLGIRRAKKLEEEAGRSGIRADH